MSYNSLFGFGTHSPHGNLLGHWLLQETTGTVATDRSGMGNHGTIHGMGANPTVESRSGSFLPSAMIFDGYDDYIDTGITWNSNDPMSFMARCKIRSSENVGLFGYRHDSVNSRLLGHAAWVGMYYYDVGNYTTGRISTLSASEGSWVNLIFLHAYSPAVQTIRQNKTNPISNTTPQIPATNGRFFIGGVSQEAGLLSYPHYGSLQDVALFNTTLSAAEYDEWEDGPEPINLTAPVLSTSGTVASGTWDNQANGTITRTTYLHLASDDSLVATLSTANPDFSSYVTSGLTYYVVERAANDGGYDAAEDTASADVLIGGGGGGGVTATPSTAALTLTAYAPDVTATDAKTVTPTTAALTLTAYAPSVTAAAHVTATAATASLTLTTYAPDVTASDAKTVVPATASLTLTAFAPTVTAGGSLTVTPSTSAITLASYAPDVTASGAVAVTPTTTALLLTAYAPDVTAGASLTVTPSTATLVLAGLAPTVTGGAGVTVTPVPATLALITYAADIITPVAVTPTPGALTITTYAPSLGGQRSAAYLYYLLNN